MFWFDRERNGKKRGGQKKGSGKGIICSKRIFKKIKKNKIKLKNYKKIFV